MSVIDRQIRQTLERFATLYPVFADAKKPLATGVRQQLAARHPEIDDRLLRAVLIRYCNRPRYLTGLANEDERYDLDGNPVGPVTEKQRENAIRCIQEYEDSRRERLRAERQREKARRRQIREAREAAERQARWRKRRSEQRRTEAQIQTVPVQMKTANASAHAPGAGIGAIFPNRPVLRLRKRRDS